MLWWLPTLISTLQSHSIDIVNLEDTNPKLTYQNWHWYWYWYWHINISISISISKDLLLGCILSQTMTMVWRRLRSSKDLSRSVLLSSFIKTCILFLCTCKHERQMRTSYLFSHRGQLCMCKNLQNYLQGVSMQFTFWSLLCKVYHLAPAHVPKIWLCHKVWQPSQKACLFFCCVFELHFTFVKVLQALLA